MYTSEKDTFYYVPTDGCAAKHLPSRSALRAGREFERRDGHFHNILTHRYYL